MLKLGLIGEGIGQSKSPDLHQRLGRLVGIDTDYQLIDSLNEADFEFVSTVARVRQAGFRGVNVTFPFKEAALKLADHAGEGARRVGSANTLLFEESGIRAENTDYTGFVSAYQYSLGERPVGKVLLVGAGGVGRAVACGLGELGVEELLIAERDSTRGEALVAHLVGLGIKARFVSAADGQAALALCSGLVNCTPVGHRNHPGCPVDPSPLTANHWVFDAVYIPAHTELLKAAEAAGSAVLSGVDLFAFQGIDAYRFFSEGVVDPAQLNNAARGIRDHYYQQLVLSKDHS
ncbi:shikimate dehydrogenase [Saccharospirillum sp. MSK14-1]|uniref:shikimate dehydrogenase family protein n=1 Tax=Saccharospirillum sp. MSK14-1 TaxID=1897632 RepID=UPI000D36878B|nr:shikimate dehydrogenase [Saccharospirillum sp. MSK14-1]